MIPVEMGTKIRTTSGQIAIICDVLTTDAFMVELFDDCGEIVDVTPISISEIASVFTRVEIEYA